MLWHNGSLPTQIIVVGSKLQCIINFMDPLHNKIHKNLCSMNNDETTLVDKIGSKKAGSLTFKHFCKVLFVLSMLMNALTQWHKNRLELQKTSQSSTGILNETLIHLTTITGFLLDFLFILVCCSPQLFPISFSMHFMKNNS